MRHNVSHQLVTRELTAAAVGMSAKYVQFWLLVAIFGDLWSIGAPEIELTLDPVV